MFVDAVKHGDAAHMVEVGVHLLGDLERAVGSGWDGKLRVHDWEDVSKAIGPCCARQLTELGYVKTGELMYYPNHDYTGWVTLRQWRLTVGGAWMMRESIRQRTGVDPWTGERVKIYWTPEVLNIGGLKLGTQTAYGAVVRVDGPWVWLAGDGHVWQSGYNSVTGVMIRRTNHRA